MTPVITRNADLLFRFDRDGKPGAGRRVDRLGLRLGWSRSLLVKATDDSSHGWGLPSGWARDNSVKAGGPATLEPLQPH